MPEGGALTLDLPEKLLPLLSSWRYKVIAGGRGKGATWNIGRALLVLGTMRVLRILCTREIQRTIRDSVHQLLKDQIAVLGLGRFYSVTDSEIRGANGTRFAFTGLRDLDAEKVKSYEAFDIAWVAEARNTSKRSWDILVPTIRKDDSEIWVDLNPEMDDDPTYTRFVEHTPKDCALMLVSWRDNPWFPPVLEKERTAMLERVAQKLETQENYDNIWEGKCRTSVDGAIYATEIREAILGKRIRPLPYDAMLKVHTVWDLGWNDTMSIIFVQRLLNQLMIIDYLEDSHKKYDWYVAEIKNRRYNLGKCYLPHDAGHESPLLTQNPVQTLRTLGMDCPDPSKSENIEIGIKRVRQTFPRLYFDEVKAAPLVAHLKRYRRIIPTTTNEPQSPLHDEHSHGADALRYLCAVAGQMTNDEQDAPQAIPETGIV